MSERERWETYFWPGTEILRNKIGMKSEAWTLLEAQLVAVREAEMPLWGFDEDTLEDELRAIHRWLFQDCYDWAGELRTVDMKKVHPLLDAVPSFLPWEEISSNLAKVQENIDILAQDRDNHAEVIEKLGQIHGMINAVHPFREGNGRATRAFMNQLAGQHDISLDWEGMKAGLHFASAISLVHEEIIDLEPWKSFYAEIARQSPWELDALASDVRGDDLAARKAIIDNLLNNLYPVPAGYSSEGGRRGPSAASPAGEERASGDSFSISPELG